MSKLAALALLTIAAASGSTEIVWKPRSGTQLERTFEITTELRSEVVEMTLDGKELGAGEPYSFTTESRRKYGIVDEFVEIGPDRPAKLVRRFEKLERVDVQVDVTPGETDTETVEYESDLEGKRVAFEWEPKSESWKRAFAGDDVGDEVLLQKLAEDMDLRAFLPREALEIGAKYAIEVRALEALLLPGGDLGLRPEKGDTFGSKFRRRLDDALLAGLKGELHGKLTALREIDGERCAVIAIEGEIRCKGEEELEEDTRTTFELELDPRGELVWNLAAGRAHSIELTARMMLDTKSVTASDDDGRTSTMTVRTRVAGTTKLAARFAAR